MDVRNHLGPGVRSLEVVRDLLRIPRPASVKEMLKQEVKLRYVGFHCFGETDELSASDEPYFTFATVPNVPERSTTVQTRVYEDVDAGETVKEVLELYKGPPLGASMVIVLREHDEGDPNRFRDNVEVAVDAVADRVVAGLEEIPTVGFALAVFAEVSLIIAQPALVDALTKLLGTDDNTIGTVPILITPLDMLRLSRENRKDFNTILAHIESPLISGLGASYKAYFDIVPA